MEEKDKLTIQEAAWYLGHEAEFELSGVKYVGILAASDISRYVTIEIDTQLYFEDTADIKLILRSIEDMTDQERQWYRMLQTTYPNMGNHYFDMYARVTNYLRSIGVDCDNLIQQGKAIRKEK